MKDLIGKACEDYFNHQSNEKIYTETTCSLKEELPINHWFRSYEAMPLVERKALQLAKGKVLDIGCGVGSHSLYLQNQGMEVEAIDISSRSVAIAKNRGVHNAKVKDLLEVEDSYDTLLLLMNGTGIFQNLRKIDGYLQHIHKLLKPNGQLLVDSSDIIYLFENEDDGSVWLPFDTGYYGAVDFKVYYKGEEESFPWLYIDFDTFNNACSANNLKCEKICDGRYYDYLARVTKE